jgi:hypothetical protein
LLIYFGSLQATHFCSASAPERKRGTRLTPRTASRPTMPPAPINRVVPETVTDQKCHERQRLAYAQCNAPSAFLNQFGHYSPKDFDFARPCGLFAAPRIGKIKHLVPGQSSRIHAATIHHRPRRARRGGARCRNGRLWPVGQIEKPYVRHKAVRYGSSTVGSRVSR